MSKELINLTGLCATFGTSTNKSPENVLHQMLTALPATHGESQVAQGNGCASHNGWSIKDEMLIITIVGKPEWKSPISNETAHKNPAQSLLIAYKKYGKACCQFICGSYAYIIIDNSTQQVIAAVDRFNRYPLMYATSHKGIALASTADALRSVIDSSINLQGIYNYVYFHMVPAPSSIYKDFYKIPAAHQLVFSQNEVQLTCYWNPEFSENTATPAKELGQQLLDTLESAVEKYIPDSMPSTFLSGGLDSSSITGMLARLRPASSNSFSIGFNAEGYDETEYARIASKHFKTKHHEYYVTPDDVVGMVPSIAASYDEPFGNSSALPTYFCAKLAHENGATTLLAGDGGDELFAGNERYLTQTIFEYYGIIPKLIRAGLIDPLVSFIPGASGPVGKLKSYVRQANIPLPERLQSYNFLHRHALEDIFHPEYISAVSSQEPLDLQRRVYNHPEEANRINKMLYLDWRFTLADNDIQKVNRMCALAGIEVAYPMLDDRVVDFSCRVPSAIKLKGNQLRSFYKNSVSGFLPAAIINKKKKGFGLPFGVWMQHHTALQELGYDNILKLKNRGYFRPEFLDQTIEMHRSEHSAYYGELVWVLMMLELWLSSHRL